MSTPGPADLTTHLVTFAAGLLDDLAEHECNQVEIKREQFDALRELVALSEGEGVRVAAARYADADDLAKACGVETGVLHWHELIERVRALRVVVEPDAAS